MSGSVRLQPVGATEILAERDDHAEILADAVDSGAGMGFLAPLDAETARRYWRKVAAEVAEGTRVMIVARVGDALAGSAQLDLRGPPNGLHRAEVQKVMVHRRFRRRGIGLALLRALDEAALAAGRTTLVLDTFADQEARRLYEAAGWTHAGDIPAFARTKDGTLGAASYYYRLLRPA